MIVHVTDNATPALKRLIAKAGSSEGLYIMGAAVKALVQEHLIKLPGNSRGWPSTGFYAKAARATNVRLEGKSAVVAISKLGIALRYYGGTVVPGRSISSATGKPTTRLAIPARAEAYGKRPGDFFSLVALWGRNGPYALVQASATPVRFGRVKKDGTRTVSRGTTTGSAVLFWLVQSATVKPDPTILPTEDQIRSTAIAAAQRFLQP